MSALIGIGLDYPDFGPKGIAVLYDQLRDRLSHVSIVALTSTAQARAYKKLAGDFPIIHHLSGVAPGDPHGPSWKTLELQDEISKELGASWCNEDIGVWSIGPYALPYFTPPLLEKDVAELIGSRISALQAKSSVPFLAEIPSCAFVAGRLSLGEFFHLLVEGSGCGIVLDVSHVYSYAVYKNEPPQAVLDAFPLDAVEQLHVAGGHIHPHASYFYVDSHTDRILDEVEALMISAVERCRRLKAITYEVHSKLGSEMISSEVDRLNRALESAGYVPELRPGAVAL